MTNYDAINEFVKHDAVIGCNHIAVKNNKLYNYSTLLCELNRDEKSAKFNTRKYSRTTGKIQSMIRAALNRAGYSIQEYTGDNCRYWNYGYQGAATLTKKDVLEYY